jgi:hypothetical protein
LERWNDGTLVGTRSTGASYRVFEINNGTLFADLSKSQRVDGARWNELGSFAFSKVGWGKVLMSRSLSTPDGSLAADAVRATLIAPSNRPPYARFLPPLVAAEGAAIAFDGSRSFDLDHDMVSHSWSFDDGSFAATAVTTHAFATNGSFEVTLTVTDPHSASGAMTRTLLVNNVPPAVDAIAGATILQGETFTATGAFTDPGADSWTGTVDFGDGSGVIALALDGQTFALTDTNDAPGAFTVIIDVFDGDDHGLTAAQIIVQSPADGIASLLAMIAALVDTGDISTGNARSLIAKLEAGQAQIAAAAHATAANQLNAFVNEVGALQRSGRLAPGNGLSDLAERIIRSLAM